MTSFSGDELLRRRVQLNGIPLGRPVDLMLEGRRVVGIDLLCGDDVHRFLPLGAAQIDEDEVRVASALAVLEAGELAFYRERGTALSSLRGCHVVRGREPTGTLEDIELERDGTVTHLRVLSGGERVRVPYDDTVSLGAARRRVPAA